MPRQKLDRKNEFIQIVIDPDEKAAFNAWCIENKKTMTEIIRKEIAPYIAKGKKLLEEE